MAFQFGGTRLDTRPGAISPTLIQQAGSSGLGGALGAMTFPMEPGFGLSLEIENLNELFANIQSGDELHILVLSEE